MAKVFHVEDADVARLVMGYLKEKRLFETLTSFQLETGVAEVPVGKDLAFLQRLALEGRWDDLVLFLEPFRGSVRDFAALEGAVLRQQYLEALSWQGGGGHRHALLPWKPAAGGGGGGGGGDLDVAALAAMLSSLEKLCPPKEFNSLCLCLTLERLGDNPDFATWSVSQGRLACYERIRAAVAHLFPAAADAGSNSSTSSSSSSNSSSGGRGRVRGLETLLAMGLAYQQQHGGGGGTRGRLTRAALRDALLVVDGIDERWLSEPLPSLQLNNALANQLYPSTNDAVDGLDDNSAAGSGARAGAPSSGSPSAASAMRMPAPWAAEQAAEAPARAPAAAAAAAPAPAAAAVPTSSPPRAPVSWTVSIGGGNAGEGDGEGEGERVTGAGGCSSEESKSGRDKPLPPRLTSRLSDARSPGKQQQHQQHHAATAGVGAGDRLRSPARAASSPSSSAAAAAAATASDDGQSRSRRSPPKPAPAAAPAAADLQGSILFRSDCPLRCILAVGAAGAEEEAQTVAVGSNDKSVKVLAYSAGRGGGNGATVEVVKAFNDVHRGSVYAMDWTAMGGSGGLLATASNDKAVRIINLDTDVVSNPIKGHTGTIRAVAFQARPPRAGPLLLASAGAGDNRPRLWDVAAAGAGASPWGTSALPAHASAVHGLAWAGDLLLSGCEGGRLVAHDPRAPVPAWSIDLTQHPLLTPTPGAGAAAGGICCLAAAADSDGPLVVAGCTGGYICVVDCGRGRRVEAVHRPHNDDVRSVAAGAAWHGAAAAQGAFGLATTSFDGCAALWDVTLSAATRRQEAAPFVLRASLNGHTDKVLGVAILPARGAAPRRVSTSGADGVVVLWDPPVAR